MTIEIYENLINFQRRPNDTFGPFKKKSLEIYSI